MLTIEDAQRQNELVLALEENLNTQQQIINETRELIQAYLQHLSDQLDSLGAEDV